MISRLSAWILLIGFFAPSFSAAETLSIAVMDFTSKGGISQEQMDSLSDMVCVEIQDLGDYRVIGKSDVRAMITITAEQRLMGCTDVVCISEIGGALGVEQLVNGNVSGFADSFLINLRRYNVRDGSLIHAVSLKVEGDASELVDKVAQVVKMLFGIETDPARADWFEVEVHTHLGESLLSDATADDGWWNASGYGNPGAWGSDWTSLNDAGSARGVSTGRGWGIGGTFGLRLAIYHLVFIQMDYIKEHWRGKAETAESEQTIPWRLDIDFDMLRLLAGYRIAYPVARWLAPFAEVSLGSNIYLPQKVQLAGEGLDAGEIELSPGARFTMLVSAGVRFQFAKRFFTSLAYQFDLPFGKVTTSGLMLGAGAHF